MKKFVVPFAISAALWGCTDFSEELQPYEPLSIKSQSDLRDLPCSSKNEGEVVFITGGGNHWSLSYNLLVAYGLDRNTVILSGMV